MTQMLGLADKDLKATLTMPKDVKENMLLMNEKIVSREIDTKKRTKWNI